MPVNDRLVRLIPKIKEKGLDALFISQPENRFYLSGFNGSLGFLLITPTKRILATDFRYTEQASKEAPDYEIFEIKGEISEWAPGLISKVSGQIGFEAGNISYVFYQNLTEAAAKAQPELKLVPLEGLVESLRMVKEPGEIELITKAVGITDAALSHAGNLISPGVTEKEIAWEIEKFIREHGSEAVAFEGIVAAGAASAMPHAKPTEHALSPGEPVVIDIGARYKYYCSDLTRTPCAGSLTDKFREIYRIVLKAQLAAIDGIRAGMSGHEADSIARNIIGEAGYAFNFGHGLGHGIGLAIHEAPRLGLNSRDVLKDGMVFTVEPGIYISGWGGVRIEDTVVMENGRVHPITRSPKIEL